VLWTKQSFEGGLYVVTTEENVGWGVVWFENPAIN